MRVFDAKPRVPRAVGATRRLRGVERDVHGGVADGVRGDANARGVGGDDPRFERLVIARRHTASQGVVRVRLGHQRRPRAEAPVQKRLGAGDAKARRVAVRGVGSTSIVAPVSFVALVSSFANVSEIVSVSRRVVPDARPVRQGQVGADANRKPPRGVERLEMFEVAPQAFRRALDGTPGEVVDVAEIAHARHAEREQMIERAAKRGVARLLRRRRDRRRHERDGVLPQRPRRVPVGVAVDDPAGRVRGVRVDARRAQRRSARHAHVRVRAEEPRLDVAREPLRRRFLPAPVGVVPPAAEHPRVVVQSRDAVGDESLERVARRDARQVELREPEPSGDEVEVRVVETRDDPPAAEGDSRRALARRARHASESAHGEHTTGVGDRHRLGPRDGRVAGPYGRVDEDADGGGGRVVRGSGAGMGAVRVAVDAPEAQGTPSRRVRAEILAEAVRVAAGRVKHRQRRRERRECAQNLTPGEHHPGSGEDRAPTRVMESCGRRR